MTGGKAELGSIMYMRYWDHVLFRNVNPKQMKPGVCEAVGWVAKEDDRAVWLLWWRPVNRLPHERPSPVASGVVILKSDILEMRKLG